MAAEKKIKKIYQFPPCPTYDVERTENWLEDMAQEGLELVGYNAFCLFSFVKTAPKAVRCRLEASQKKRTIWNDAYAPPQKMLELAQECGWDFVTGVSDFYIFRTEDPSAPELHTDPGIQAATLKVLKRRWRVGLIPLALCLAVLLFGIGPGFFYHMAAYDPILMIFAFLFSIWAIIFQFLAQHRIARLCRSLASGDSLTHRGQWRKSAKTYRFSLYASYVLALLILVSACRARYYDSNMAKRPLEEFPGAPPFVTLEELAPENMQIVYDKINNGYFKSRSDTLIPVNYQWLDGGTVTYPGGNEASGILEIHYCEVFAPWFARAVAKDYMDYYTFFSGTNAIELPDLGVDYAAAFYDKCGLSRIVLAEGSTVV